MEAETESRQHGDTESSKDIWQHLPFPPYKSILQEVLNISKEPKDPQGCDRNPLSPEITGAKLQNNCSIELPQIYEKVKESAVQVVSRRANAKPSFGSAALVCDKNCYYVTNDHVAGNSDTVGIFSPDHRKITYGRVLARDPILDIAIVEPPFSVKSTVRIGEKPKVGDSVFTIGHPYGSPYDVIGAGKVLESSRDFLYKDPDGTIGKYKDLIASDIPVVPGNSGGPEFNARGELIGIKAVAKQQESGTIPIESVLSMIKQLEEKRNGSN